MVNTRPGYWDVDRCTWVGVDPTYVVPPVRPSRQAPVAASPPHPVTGAADPAGAQVPQPRGGALSDDPVS